jgi:hypothetical protein
MTKAAPRHLSSKCVAGIQRHLNRRGLSNTRGSAPTRRRNTFISYSIAAIVIAAAAVSIVVFEKL